MTVRLRFGGMTAGFCNPIAEMIGVVALVGDRGGETLDKFVGKGDVVALPGRSNQAHRIAERVASGVDFRTQASA